MAMDQRLERLGLAHLKDKPQELKAELLKQSDEYRRSTKQQKVANNGSRG